MFFLKDECKICNIPFKVNRFPDGTLSLGKVSNCYNEILWLYEGDEELFTLMCLRDHLKNKNMTLIMPYLPHARMDRTEDGEVFTLKTFCKIINDMNFYKVVVADPHSNVSVALLDRLEVISPERYIKAVIDKIPDNFILFFPDEVIQVGEQLGLPNYLLSKIPEDGLSGLTDEQNLGLSYKELNDYIRFNKKPNIETLFNIERRHSRNFHKTQPMPVFRPNCRDFEF